MNIVTDVELALMNDGLLAKESEKEDERWEDDGGSTGVTIIDGSDIKDYQSYENARNKANAQLFQNMMQAAFGDEASNVLVAHHLNFEHGSDIRTVNEIPSADCLIFDHVIMTRIFGKELAIKHMMLLASIPVERRDGVLAVLFRERT